MRTPLLRTVPYTRVCLGHLSQRTPGGCTPTWNTWVGFHVAVEHLRQHPAKKRWFNGTPNITHFIDFFSGVPTKEKYRCGCQGVRKGVPSWRRISVRCSERCRDGVSCCSKVFSGGVKLGCSAQGGCSGVWSKSVRKVLLEGVRCIARTCLRTQWLHQGCSKRCSERCQKCVY